MDRLELPTPPRTGTRGALELRGTFRKYRIDPLKRYGAYRGHGSLTLTPDGISISGSHVYPLGMRLAMILGVCLVGTVLTRGLLWIPGLVPLYFLSEYLVLKHEDLFVPWERIVLVRSNERKRAVAIVFEGPMHVTPAVLRTDFWRDLERVANTYIRRPQARPPSPDATPPPR
jgi:hypothetical protein